MDLTKQERDALFPVFSPEAFETNENTKMRAFPSKIIAFSSFSTLISTEAKTLYENLMQLVMEL